MFKSGFVSIVGRPNAGKSSLINQLVNQKVAIVTDKPQTTRNPITAIYDSDEAQIIYIDTPGIHKPKHSLGSRMNFASYQHFKGVDIIYYLLDGSVDFGKGDRFVIKRLAETNVPVFLLINKIDLMDEKGLEEKRMLFQDMGFAEIIPISAKEGFYIDELKAKTLEYLEEGPRYYPKDQVSAHPEQFMISEIIREKLILHTEEELPHSIAVSIESIQHKKNVTVISAIILVSRDSQKGMVIGKGGRMIRQVGAEARNDIESLLQRKVYLETHVRVEKDWRNRAKILDQLGYVKEEYD